MADIEKSLERIANSLEKLVAHLVPPAKQAVSEEYAILKCDILDITRKDVRIHVHGSNQAAWTWLSREGVHPEFDKDLLKFANIPGIRLKISKPWIVANGYAEHIVEP